MTNSGLDSNQLRNFQYSPYAQLGHLKPPSTQSEPERELWRGNFSGKSMFGAWLGAIVTMLALFITIGILPALNSNVYVWIFAFGFVVLMWTALVGSWLYQKLGHQYTLTTHRLLHRDGIVVRKTGLVELIDVDDVSYQQGPIQAALGVGNIIVLSSDTSHPQLNLRGIANVRKVADMLDEARRKERRERGLHIESI